MNKISDLMGSADKNLDQVKKSVQADLEMLKKKTDTGASLFAAAESGFKKDLEEIGITGPAQTVHLTAFKEEWQKMEMGKKASEILNSPELAAMDAFIMNVQNLPKLKEVIDSAEPKANWEIMLKGFASKIPGLSEFLDKGGFDTILNAVGLGFLVTPKTPKTEGQTAEGAAPAAAPAADPTAETAEVGMETVPETFKPGKTLIMGDSNFNVFAAGPDAAFKDKMNVTGMITKGAMQSSWGLREAQAKPKEYFQEFEYVAIGFGSNDMGSEDSAEKIWGRLKEIAQTIKEKNPNIKILMATVPPGKGNTSGLWQTNFDSVEERRAKVNEFIKAAERDGTIAGVIDLAAPKSKGGLAADEDPHSLATEYRRFRDDPVHAKADILATAINRTQYRESNEAKA